MSDTAHGSRAGSQFGHYHLKRLLGRGGMGEVYEAEDTLKERVVALKLMTAAFSQDPVFRKRLQREARSAGRLHEPHVVPIHDYGEIDGQLYVDMRLIEGTDLHSLLSRFGPLAPARAVAIIRQIASALDAAHAAGVMHRDVKPGNILITRDDFAYLVDFGIANAATDEKLTKLGDVVGTYAYMAPERLTDDEVTGSADIYALACVLYESLIGSAPFRGNAATVITAHLNNPIPKPSEHRPGIPGSFDSVIARGMAKRPSDRYSTAGDFATAALEALTSYDKDRAADILNRSQIATLPGKTTPSPPPQQPLAATPPPYQATPPPYQATPRPQSYPQAWQSPGPHSAPAYQAPPHAQSPGLGSRAATPIGGFQAATQPPAPPMRAWYGQPPAPPTYGGGPPTWQPPPAPPSGKRKWWLLGGVAALVVVVALVAGIIVLTWPKPPPPDPVTLRDADAGVFVGDPSAPVTIDVFDEPICPPCGDFISTSADNIQRAVVAKKIAVRYHLLNFLDKQSASRDYSTRALAASLCVAHEEKPKVYMDFYAGIFSPKFQPKEGASTDRTDDELAKLAESVGAPSSVSTCITSGDKMSTARTKAGAAQKSLTAVSSEGTTPAVFDGSKQIDIKEANWVDSLS